MHELSEDAEVLLRLCWFFFWHFDSHFLGQIFCGLRLLVVLNDESFAVPYESFSQLIVLVELIFCLQKLVYSKIPSKNKQLLQSNGSIGRQ